jgi:uncharacterized protein involved in cysteine biosynthesis
MTNCPFLQTLSHKVARGLKFLNWYLEFGIYWGCGDWIPAFAGMTNVVLVFGISDLLWGLTLHLISR